MKPGSTMFLRTVVYIMGLGVVALCIFVLPPTIGEIDFASVGYDPILLGMYVSAIPFFIALWQALKLLRYIDKNTAFSPRSVTALKNIKYCGSAISALFILGLPYIYIVAEKDDAPGVILIGLIIIAASIVIAVFAALLQKLLQNAIDIKKENELTV